MAPRVILKACAALSFAHLVFPLQGAMAQDYFIRQHLNTSGSSTAEPTPDPAPPTPPAPPADGSRCGSFMDIEDTMFSYHRFQQTLFSSVPLPKASFDRIGALQYAKAACEAVSVPANADFRMCELWDEGTHWRVMLHMNTPDQRPMMAGYQAGLHQSQCQPL